MDSQQNLGKVKKMCPGPKNPDHVPPKVETLFRSNFQKNAPKDRDFGHFFENLLGKPKIFWKVPTHKKWQKIDFFDTTRKGVLGVIWAVLTDLEG